MLTFSANKLFSLVRRKRKCFAQTIIYKFIHWFEHWSSSSNNWDFFRHWCIFASSIEINIFRTIPWTQNWMILCIFCPAYSCILSLEVLHHVHDKMISSQCVHIECVYIEMRIKTHLTWIWLFIINIIFMMNYCTICSKFTVASGFVHHPQCQSTVC